VVIMPEPVIPKEASLEYAEGYRQGHQAALVLMQQKMLEALKSEKTIKAAMAKVIKPEKDKEKDKE
jgi:hypothetical protein